MADINRKASLASFASTASSSSTGARKRTHLDAHRVKGWKNIWHFVYKPALEKAMVALSKDNSAKVLPLISMLIETIQLVAYGFPNIDWGTYGQMFGFNIRFVQFDYIVYYGFSMSLNASTGWLEVLDPIQEATMWILTSFVLALILTMVFLLGYIVFSFSTNLFTVGLVPSTILRRLVFLLCGAFYIPMIQVLFSAIRIGIPALEFMGIVGVILAIPFSIFMSLANFQSNPASKSLLCRSNPYMGMIELVFRTLVVFLNSFAYRWPFARTIVMFVFGVVLIGFVVRELPYYRFGVNNLKSVLFTITSFTGLIGTAAAFGYGSYFQTSYAKQGDALAIFYFVFTPILAIISAKVFQMYYLRATRSTWKFLLTQMKPGDDSSDYLLVVLSDKNFASPYHVEIQTRFVRETAKVRRSKRIDQDDELIYDPIALIIATAIIRRGVELFPQSALMMTMNGLFYGIYKSDFTRWRQALDIAQELEPNFLQSIFLLQSISQRDQAARKKRTGTDLDMVDLEEIKTVLRIAKHRTNNVKEYASELWKMLITNKIDVIRVQRLVTKMYLNEKAANTLYESTLTKYPESIQVVKAYAIFLDEIVRDYAEADDLWHYAAELEKKMKEEVELNADDAASSNAHEIERSNKAIVQGSVQGSNGSSTQSGSVISDASSAISDASSAIYVKRNRSISAKEVKRLIEYKKSTNKLHSNAIPKASFVFRLSFLTFIVAPLIQLIWMLEIGSDIRTNIKNIQLSSSRRELAVEIPYKMSVMRKLIVRNDSIASGFDQRFYNLIAGYRASDYKETYVAHPRSGLYVPWEYATLEQQISESMDTFEEIQSSLFFSADQGATYFSKWIQSTVPLNISRGANADRWINTLSYWDASSEFWRNGRDVLYYKDLLTKYRNGTCDSDFSWRFVFDNFPYIYADSYDQGTSDYTTENTLRIKSLLNISWMILGISGGIVVIVGAFFIRPCVNTVFREFDLATAALMAVPKELIEAHYSKIKQIMNITDKKKKKDIDGIEKSRAIEGEDSDDDDDDDALLVTDDNIASGGGSRRALFWKYTAGYTFSLLFVIGLFVLMTVLTYYNCLSLIQWGIRADLSLRIRYVLWRLAYDTHMLAENDVATYVDINYLKEKLTSDLALYNDIQLALLFGNPKLGLDVGRLPDVLRPVMFVHYYLDNTSSLDEMVNVVLQTLATIDIKSYPLAENDEDYSQLVERIPLIVSGFGKAAGVNNLLLQNQLGYLTSISVGLFCVSIVGLFIMFIIIYRYVLEGLKDENDKAKRMLSQIPLQAVKLNYPLQALLRGEEAAKEIFINHEVPGIRVTEDGLPFPEESVLNLAYSKAILKKRSWSSIHEAFSNFVKLFKRNSKGSIRKKETQKDNKKQDMKINAVRASPEIRKTKTLDVAPSKKNDKPGVGFFGVFFGKNVVPEKENNDTEPILEEKNSSSVTDSDPVSQSPSLSSKRATVELETIGVKFNDETNISIVVNDTDDESHIDSALSDSNQSEDSVVNEPVPLSENVTPRASNNSISKRSKVSFSAENIFHDAVATVEEQ